MLNSQQWVLDADAFLASPPLKLDLVCRRRRRQSRGDNGITSKNGVLRLLLAAFLDVFCETLPESHREHVKHELSLTLVKLKVVPSLIFAEEFSSLRKSFAGVLSSVLYNCFTSDPKVDCRLSIESCEALLSRYRTDFEEIEQIGAGGFGTVKSLVDRCYYAIKKIPVKSDVSAVAMKVLNEVHILAALHHENIVRYHSGWTELHQMRNRRKIGKNHNDDPVKITELNDSDTDVDSHEPSISGLTETVYTNSNQSSNTVTSESGSYTGTAAPRMKFWARREGDQIAFPEFSDDSLERQATGLSSEVVEVVDPICEVDIYSVGIVLFEAYHVFNTDMEKYEAISDVRLGKTTKELLARHHKFAQNWPSVASTIFEMTAMDPASRPTATQLLQRYIHIESKKVLQLKNIIRNQSAQLVAAEKRIQEL
ncbi:hypothetical protein Angca_010070, partial [Angiostrongylus cantonensis]